MLTASVGSCARAMNGQGGPAVQGKLKKATIEVWVDRAGRCRTNTSPFVQVKKNEKATWDIKTNGDCDYEIEIKFDKGDGDPLVASCSRKNKTKIECEIDTAAAVKRYDYSVIINGIVEDPEIEIVM
jgi:hypothetical protein